MVQDQRTDQTALLGFPHRPASQTIQKQNLPGYEFTSRHPPIAGRGSALLGRPDFLPELIGMVTVLSTCDPLVAHSEAEPSGL
jgi:hypothetical protein